MKRKRKAAVKIRIMRLDDLPEVVRISNQAFVEISRRPSYLSLTLSQFQHAPDWSFMAMVGRQRAGFLVASPKEKSEKANLNLKVQGETLRAVKQTAGPTGAAVRKGRDRHHLHRHAVRPAFL